MNDENENAALLEALEFQHPLALVDRLLNVRAENGLVKLTLGWADAAGKIRPAVTLAMSETFASAVQKALAKAGK